MAEFKLVINEKTGKSYKKLATESESDTFRGKKIGDKISGNSIGLSGYELEITGGSDKQGFPLRKDLEGSVRKKPLVVKGVGAKRKERGIKQRKTVRGNMLDVDVSQINLKVVKEGPKKLEEILGKKEEGAQENDAQQK